MFKITTKPLNTLLCLLTCAFIVTVACTVTACDTHTATAEAVDAITPENAYTTELAPITPQLIPAEDYAYWTMHAVNGSNIMFWDMASNEGSGCGLGTLVYCTQLINPEDAGYELGYPTAEMINEVMTEQQVLFAMSGLNEGEWGENSAGERVRYDMFRAEMYNVTDLSGNIWDFFVYDYTLATKDDPDGTHYFNLLGVTPCYDEWLTVELTGSLTADMEHLQEFTEIFNEFSAIYGFEDKLPYGDNALYLMGLDYLK